MKPFCLDVRGDYACFSRPEFKAERVSYDVITPSAARAIFESILWKPGLRWRVERVEVLAPVRWISVRRNEVGAVASTRNVQVAMVEGAGRLALYVEDERQQRAGLFLRDVAYRIHARLEMVGGDAKANPGKYLAMFTRRALAGQCTNQPYLGCREFAAHFRLVELVEDRSGDWQPAADEPPPLKGWNTELGWMFHDFDYADANGPRPSFFRAVIEDGVLDVRTAELRS